MAIDVAYMIIKREERMNRTINVTREYKLYRPTNDILASLSRVIAVVEYNLIDSGFFGLHNNILNMITNEEAQKIIDYLAEKARIEDIDLLIDELQVATEIELSPNTVLFVMISPVIYIAEQLHIDEDTAQWLYDKLHLHFITDDIIGWMKELFLEAESYKQLST